MFYKKAQTDTAIIISIIAFQAVIILGLGFLSITPDTQSVGAFSFTENLVTNIELLGWANALIFTPLVVGFIYIIARLIRGGG